MIRRPPRSTQSRSSAASDVYKRQGLYNTNYEGKAQAAIEALRTDDFVYLHIEASDEAVSYTHLRAHETVLDLVCRLLLEKKKKRRSRNDIKHLHQNNSQHDTVTKYSNQLSP